MATGTIYAGDVGRLIQITVNTTGVVTGSTVTSAVVRIYKPSGAVASYSFTVAASSASTVTLTRTSAGDECDEAGKAYARVWLYVSGVEAASTPEFLLFDVRAARVTQP